jgi:tape measure domain-containing protein
MDSRLSVLIDGQTGGLQAALGRASREVQNFGNSTKSALTGLSVSFRQLGQIAGGIFSAQTLRSALQTADAYTQLEARVRGITKSTGDFVQVFEGLKRISQDTGARLEDTVSVFQALARSSRELKATNAQMLVLTGLVQKLGVLGGASTTALSAGLLQFSQAMAAGVVRAEEFNSILENLPELANAIAAGLGKSVGELRKMVLAGKLFSRDVFDALIGQATEINAKFAELPPTLERGWSAFTQGVDQAIARLNSALGITQRLGNNLAAVGSYLRDLTEQERFNQLVAERQRLLQIAANQSPTGPGGRPNQAFGQAQRELIAVEKELRKLQEARVQAQQKESEQAAESAKLTTEQKLRAQDAEKAVKSLAGAYDDLVAKIRAGQAAAKAEAGKPLEKSSVLDINRLRDRADTALREGRGGDAEKAIRQAQEINDYLLESGQITKGYYQSQAALLLDLAETARAALADSKLTVQIGVDEAASDAGLTSYAQAQQAFMDQNPLYRQVILQNAEELPAGITEAVPQLLPVPGLYASGGPIAGPGTATSDSVLARLSAGEYVVRAAAVKAYGLGFLERLNSMRLPKFGFGGLVPAFAGGGSVGTPVHLHIGGESLPMSAAPDVAKTLQRVMRTEVLKRGRR